MIAALVVLVVGFTAALLVYSFADEGETETSSYIVVDGLKYPIDPASSKRYVRDLEMYGGKASVVFDEFNRWFGSLWQGRKLAFTLAWLSALVSGALFLFGRSLK
jgi:hypothetical protein